MSFVVLRVTPVVSVVPVLVAVVALVLRPVVVVVPCVLPVSLRVLAVHFSICVIKSLHRAGSTLVLLLAPSALQ